MTWNPASYLRFEAAREAPFADLLAMIDKRPDMRVVDLGCGTGNITKQLADALPNADVTGIDSSSEMLAEAAPLARPGLRFEKGEIEHVSGNFDLVFSHAALHWVYNHMNLIERLLECVAPGGQLAVQVPSNHNHVSHTTVIELANEPRFDDVLLGYRHDSPVLTIDRYAELLHVYGAVDIHVMEKVYPVMLDGIDGLLNWLSGTTLVPYTSRLDEATKQAFLSELRTRYANAGLDQPRLFYPFRRILFTCRKR